MKKQAQITLLLILLSAVFSLTNATAQRQMESLNRGVVAVRNQAGHVSISWRLLTTDKPDTAFDLYRKTGNEQASKINTKPISDGTFYEDTDAESNLSYQYYILPSGDAHPLFTPQNVFSLQANADQPYLTIPLQIPPTNEVNGISYTYSANDASIGDLDGDGEWEIILKWNPSLVRNPPQKGLTGEQILDAYKLDGTLLWRINLGKNIRAGAAYTQFLVYDFNNDGKAEMMCKTADGTIDGAGKILGDADKDWRTFDESSRFYGKVVEGPEYLTVFDGATGKALATTEYIPSRYPLDGWGGSGGNGNNDNNGGRADRFSAAVAYLDGHLPSAVFVRGWYGRTVAAAWDYRDGKLTSRWVFDSKNAENPYSGQGNHNLSVADVDNDDKDELCIGSMTLDDDGTGLYSTGLRHGDALHLSDLDPNRPGLEVFGIHENGGKTIALGTPGVAMFDAATGKILFEIGPGVDVGRGVAADIDPRFPGCENWGGPGGLRDVQGKTISHRKPSSCNFVVWWDGDLNRELLDHNHIDKWDWENEQTINLLTADECTSNNGTKAVPCFSGDVLGDWREEVIWRTHDNTALHIYTTTSPTPYRFTTLLSDPQYRLSLVWQNVAYNQPPHPGFYLGTE